MMLGFCWSPRYKTFCGLTHSGRSSHLWLASLPCTYDIEFHSAGGIFGTNLFMMIMISKHVFILIFFLLIFLIISASLSSTLLIFSCFACLNLQPTLSKGRTFLFTKLSCFIMNGSVQIDLNFISLHILLVLQQHIAKHLQI